MTFRKRLVVGLASCALVLLSAAAAAQETKKSILMKNFEIVSVDGNNVVYRTAEGTKEITLGEDFKLDMDGKKIGVQDLQPGMKGTAYLVTTTTTQPVVVTEVRNAQVMAVAGNAVIVKGQDGFRKFTLDDIKDKNITIMRNGQRVDLSQLRTNDNLTATIITRLPPVVVSQAELSASVSAPAAAAPAAAAPPPAAAPAAGAPPPAAAPAESSAKAPASSEAGAPAAAAPAAAPAAAASSAAEPPAPAAAAPAAAPAETPARTGFPVLVWVALAVLVILILALWSRSRRRPI